MHTEKNNESDGFRQKTSEEARDRAKVIIRYFGGARHFASITGVTYQTVYNYIHGFYALGQHRKDCLLSYAHKMGLDFVAEDFEDTSRIEAIMNRPIKVQCVLCLDQPCQHPVDYRKVPWFMGSAHD